MSDTSNPNVLKSYTEEVLNTGQPILGLLTWYSVPSTCEVEYGEFIRLINDFDAPITKMKPPSPNNVFRRACSHSKLHKQPGPDVDVFCNYLFKDVSYDKTSIYKAVVEEIVDRANHTLGHRVIADVVFAKNSYKVHIDPKIPEDDYARPSLDALTSAMRNFIHSKGTVMHDLVIREAARRAVEGPLSGVRVRPGGGVYFVSNEHSKGLEAVDGVINGIAEADFHMLPLVDDLKQRNMLKGAFQDESVGEAHALMAEIADLLAEPKSVPAKKFVELQTRYGLMQNKMKEYSKLLDDSMDTASTTLDICSRQLTKLVKREMNDANE